MTLYWANGRKLPLLNSRIVRVLAIAATLMVIGQSLRGVAPAVHITNFDKIMHFIAYFSLAGLWSAALPKRSLAHIIGALIALGIGIEIAQGLMSAGRTASPYDAIANGLGALAGAGLSAIILNRSVSGKNATTPTTSAANDY
ncbi:MAG: VanZ family protein [Robiginitomaculum sp.]